MRFKLIIFDLDGVLVDSEPISNRVLHEMLLAAGLKISYEDVFAQFTGLSVQSCISLIEQQFNHTLPADFRSLYNTRTTEALTAKLKPITGVVSVLENIKQPICIASGSNHERIKLSLQVTNLTSRFDGNIFSARDVENGKPAPDLFLYTAKQMGYSPKDCAVIEDSVPGVQAGIAAGMTVFGYTSSLSADTLTKAGAHHVFDDMYHLSDLLNSKLEA